MSLKLAILLVITLGVNYKVEAADDLSKVCQRLDDINYYLSSEIEEDANKFLSHSEGVLNRVVSVGNYGEVAFFRLAWIRALRRKGCYQDALKDLARISRCNPGRFESMRTLTKAAKNLANNCLSSRYIAGKIEIADKGRISELLDHSFVEDYQKENSQDEKMDLTTVTSEKAILPLSKSIVRELEQRGKIPKDRLFHMYRDDIRKYLDKHLYKPCIRIASVMKDISEASLFFDGGLAKLLSHFNEETREAVFLANVCKIFIDENRPERLTREMWHHL